jgi:hypothetical protein
MHPGNCQGVQYNVTRRGSLIAITRHQSSWQYEAQRFPSLQIRGETPDWQVIRNRCQREASCQASGCTCVNVIGDCMECGVYHLPESDKVLGIRVFVTLFF